MPKVYHRGTHNVRGCFLDFPVEFATIHRRDCI